MPYHASPDILRLDDDAELSWQAIEPLWDAAPLSGQKLVQFMSQLTVGQAALLAIDLVQKGIRNGGYRQMFGNSTGNYVPWAIEGFRLIDAELYAANLAEAMGLLSSEYPASGAARKRALQALDQASKDRLEALSDRFLDLIYDSATDLEALRARFVRTHPQMFVSG